MNSIFTRRSVRTYKDKPVEKGKIEKLLKAAMQAPSAWNQQGWEFIVVENKDTLEKLSKTSQYAGMTANCAVAIVILANGSSMKVPEYWQQDLGAATQNLLIEATELDLGAVWLGVAPEKERVDYVKDLFNLSDNIVPYAIISVGYPEGAGNRFVDRYDASKVHYEKY